jgi:hypothetical protein
MASASVLMTAVVTSDSAAGHSSASRARALTCSRMCTCEKSIALFGLRLRGVSTEDIGISAKLRLEALPFGPSSLPGLCCRCL